MIALWPGRLDSKYWCIAKDGDAEARAIHRRHYSARHYKDGRKPKLFVGPGFKFVLITPNGDAHFVWRLFISDAGETGINCAAFRNEGATRSSDLILDAEKLAIQKWPKESRFYTYVDPREVKSEIPGYCFIRAKWKRLKRRTPKGLHILEKRIKKPAEASNPS